MALRESAFESNKSPSGRRRSNREIVFFSSLLWRYSRAIIGGGLLFIAAQTYAADAAATTADAGVTGQAATAAANAEAGTAGQVSVAPAADTTVIELQAEVAQLKAALEKSQRDLAEQQAKQPTTGAVPDSATPANTAGQQGIQPTTGTDSTTTGVSEAAPAEANQPAQLSQVTVKAPNRLKAVKDVPTSISVVSGADLAQQDAIDMSAIAKRTSDLTFNAGNSREFSLSIRGLGYESNTEAEDPSVGITVDGVSYGYSPLSSFDFTDLDTVQVLRGPQGTLGGKSADLGVVNISTKAPTFTPETNFSIAYGQYSQNDLGGRIIATGVIGGPIVDDLLAWRGTLSIDKGSGYIKNLYNPSQTYGNTDRVAGRVQFLLTPSDNLRARFRFDFEPSGAEYYNDMTIYTQTPLFYANGAPNPLSTDAQTRLGRSWFTQNTSYSYAADYLNGAGQNAVDVNSQQPLITNSHGASAQLDWNLGAYTLTSITGYKEYNFYASNDEGTPFDVTTASGGGVNYHQESQELRLSSPIGGFVDYTTGLYFLDSVTTGALNVSKNGWGSDAGAWFSSNSQYSTLDANANGQILMVNSLDGMREAGYEDAHKQSSAIFGQANWHLSEPLTLTTGLRLTYEERHTWDQTLITNNGNGAALNPVLVNNVQLGGFYSTSAGALGTAANPNANDAAQIALANAVALQYFSVPTYSSLSTAQQSQVAAAKALRQSQMKVLWNPLAAQPFTKVQPSFIVSPSYKINQNLTTYVSYQLGEKAGISQNTNGVSNFTQPEKNVAYELGLKSLFLDKTLTFNADVFLNEISNYQQATEVYDAYTTALNAANGITPPTAYVSATGAAARVQAAGLEVDGVYSGIPYTSLRFSGAYDDTVYKDFKNAAQPLEDGNLTTPYQDDTGKALPGAAKVTFNLGADFRHPILSNKEFFTNFNTAYTTRYNSDTTGGLSSYAWIPAHAITDFSIGVGRSDRSFDFSLLAKNLFNNQAHLATTWDTYTPAPPRWLGLQVSGKW